MDNEIKILGRIDSKYITVQKQDEPVLHFFKLKVERSSYYKINNKGYDFFNCVVPDHVENNPDRNLLVGNLARISGSLQSNKLILDGKDIEVVYIIVLKLHVERKSSTIANIKTISSQTPTKQKGTYTKNQRYSSSKPYHDGFPKEHDVRGNIRCVCGHVYKDDIAECPVCGLSAVSNLRNN